MKKGAAAFSILMGLAMFGTWTFLFATGAVPQVATLPVETGYLLVAEFLTAAALIAGGCGLFANHSWGLPLMLVALGELTYCAIRFAGELGQEGSMAGLAFFSGVGAAGLVFASLLVMDAGQKKSRGSSFGLPEKENKG